jgi:hypothetical protein
MAVSFDTARFPVVVLTFSGVLMETEITRAGLQVLGALQRKEPFVLITDMRAGFPNPLQGKTLSAMLEGKRDDARRYVRGNCMVLTSPIIRAALRGALVASRPPFPVHIESSMMAAEEIAKKLMAR